MYILAPCVRTAGYARVVEERRADESSASWAGSSGTFSLSGTIDTSHVPDMAGRWPSPLQRSQQSRMGLAYNNIGTSEDGDSPQQQQQPSQPSQPSQPQANSSTVDHYSGDGGDGGDGGDSLNGLNTSFASACNLDESMRSAASAASDRRPSGGIIGAGAPITPGVHSIIMELGSPVHAYDASGYGGGGNRHDHHHHDHDHGGYTSDAGTADLGGGPANVSIGGASSVGTEGIPMLSPPGLMSTQNLSGTGMMHTPSQGLAYRGLLADALLSRKKPHHHGGRLPLVGADNIYQLGVAAPNLSSSSLSPSSSEVESEGGHMPGYATQHKHTRILTHRIVFCWWWWGGVTRGHWWYAPSPRIAVSSRVGSKPPLPIYADGCNMNDLSHSWKVRRL